MHVKNTYLAILRAVLTGSFQGVVRTRGVIQKEAGEVAFRTVSTCRVARERTSLCGRRSSAGCPGPPYPTWKGAPTASGLGPTWLVT